MYHIYHIYHAKVYSIARLMADDWCSLDALCSSEGFSILSCEEEREERKKK